MTHDLYYKDDIPHLGSTIQDYGQQKKDRADRLEKRNKGRSIHRKAAAGDREQQGEGKGARRPREEPELEVGEIMAWLFPVLHFRNMICHPHPQQRQQSQYVEDVKEVGSGRVQRMTSLAAPSMVGWVAAI